MYIRSTFPILSCLLTQLSMLVDNAPGVRTLVSFYLDPNPRLDLLPEFLIHFLIVHTHGFSFTVPDGNTVLLSFTSSRELFQ